jgi:predicted ABC-type ATPase
MKLQWSRFSVPRRLPLRRSGTTMSLVEQRAALRRERWQRIRVRSLELLQRYSEDEPRDEAGRWTDGGGGGGDGGGSAGDGSGSDSGPSSSDRAMAKTDADKFVGARDKNTRSYFLSAKTADELKNDRLFLSNDGHTGYALDPDGDLQNLFNNGPRGGGRVALQDAIRNGATTLDAFDGHLPALYAQHGFAPTGRMKFNDEYAPAGWDFNKYGRPDIVFMAYRGGDRATADKRTGSYKPYDPSAGKYFTDYDTAKAASRSAVLDKRAQPHVPPLDRTRAEHRGCGQLHQELADPSRRPDQSGQRLQLSDDAQALRSARFRHLKRKFHQRYSEDEPRDDQGRWTDGGDGGGGGGGSTAPLSHEEHAAQIVAAVSGAKEKIEAAKAKLAQGVRSDAPVAQGGHKTPDGHWTAARQEVHKAILGKVFTPEAVAAATPKAGERPVAHLLGGSGGSGKSWFTGKNGTIDKNKTIYLNSDDMKAALPEYQGWNAALLHEESSDLAATAESVAREHGLNVIIDGTMGDPKKLDDRVQTYKDAGYRVAGHFMRVKPETSAKRAVERFVRGGETGRLVAPAMILASNNAQNFEKSRGKMDASELFDNEGKAPKLIDRR